MAEGGQLWNHHHEGMTFVQQNPSPTLSKLNYDCRVCKERYSVDGEKVPRLLSCGHSVCHQCLTRLNVDARNCLINCPFDRQPTPLPPVGVSALKKNFALIEVLESCTNESSLQITNNQLIDPDVISEQEQLALPCDEDGSHIAVLYCTQCESSLCLLCAEFTHRSRTLSKHRRVPLSERTQARPCCQTHGQHVVEFICLDPACQAMPFMCYICKEYGKHNRHPYEVYETQVANLKQSLRAAVQLASGFTEDGNSALQEMNSFIARVTGDPSQNIGGAAAETKEKIHTYFEDLHQTLRDQEAVALTVIDRHIAERLLGLTQQREIIANFVTKATDTKLRCLHILQQDDQKLLRCQNEIGSVMEALRIDQQIFSELPERIVVESTIPITFTRDNRLHIGAKMEMRVVVLGLDDSGKTSILFRLKQNEFIESTPTIGFNVEPVEYKNLRFTVWDVGGLPKLRPLWKHYFHNTQALIFVVDGSNESRMEEAYNELAKLVQEPDLRDAAVLLLANKMDKPNHLSVDTITTKLNLYKLCIGRSWHIQECDASSGAGLTDGLDWLSKQMVATGTF